MLIGLEHPFKGKILLKNCVEEFSDLAPRPLTWDIISTINEEWRKGKVSASMIMTCPAKSYLQQEVDYYLPLEDLYWAGFRGTLKHEALAKYGVDNKDLLIEKRLATKIGGVKITGQIDAYDFEELILMDWKTCKYIKVDSLPYGEHITQVKAYAVILEDNKYPVNEIQITYLDASGWATVHITSDGAYVSYKGKDKWEELEIKELYLEPTVKFRAEIKDRVVMVDQVIRGKITAPCEPSYLCDGKNRTGKIYCPVFRHCEYWKEKFDKQNNL